MRISDWSSDVCSSDLCDAGGAGAAVGVRVGGDVLAARNLPAGRRGNRHGVPAPGGGRPCAAGRRAVEIGRASGRERGWQYVEISGGAESITKKQKKRVENNHMQKQKHYTNVRK